MAQHARDKHFSGPADSRSDTLTADARRLRALAGELRQAVRPKREKAQADLAALLAASRTVVAERRGKLPKPEFPPELPINERRADIAELIAGWLQEPENWPLHALVDPSNRSFTHQAAARSNCFQRKTTGAAFIS